jgi:hypothetical protein
MVWTDLYLSIGWHIVLCLVAIIVGIVVWSNEDSGTGFIIILISVLYFLFAPYAHEEQIRNCQTKNGNTVSVIVKFKEPIIKAIFTEPKDVKVTSINGKKCVFKLKKSLDKEVFKQTVFEGDFNDERGNRNTLAIIL